MFCHIMYVLFSFTCYMTNSENGNCMRKHLDNIGVAPIRHVTNVRNKNSNIQGRSLNV